MRLASNKVLLLVASAAVLIAVSGFGIHRISRGHVAHWESKLTLLASLRTGALQGYFDTVRSEVTFWSLTPDILAAQRDFLRAWAELGLTRTDARDALIARYTEKNRFPLGTRHRLFDAGDDSSYNAAHKRFHGTARPFVRQRGYYDFFLISTAGDILYTVGKEADFGTNLNSGPWRNTGLADAFRRALAKADLHAVAFSDMSAYGPSLGDPAVFAATAMVDDAGELLGVLAVQVPLAPIQDIMQFTAGMGDTGETYLVGPDRLMRSQSRFVETSTILSTKVDTDTVRAALAGNAGVARTPDYRGVPVLSAYNNLDLDGVVWAIVAEIDDDEVFEALAVQGGEIAGLGVLLWLLSAWSIFFLNRVEPSALDAVDTDSAQSPEVFDATP
jgi:methyl-accepting chemotaxis protein